MQVHKVLADDHAALGNLALLAAVGATEEFLVALSGG